MIDRAEVKAVGLVFVVALCIRLGHLAGLASSPYLEHAVLDDALYHMRAIGILDGTWPGRAVYPQGPFYSFVLALVYLVTGPSRIAARILGAVLSAVCAALVTLLARRLTGAPRLALASGLITALTGTLVFLDTEVMPSALPTLLNLGMLLALMPAAPSPEGTMHDHGRAGPLLAGLFTGLSAATRGSVLLFVPFACLALWSRRGLRAAVLYLGALSATVAPFSLHNLVNEDIPQICLRDPTPDELAAAPELTVSQLVRRLVTLNFSVVSCNGGLNFYLGNHPDFVQLNRLDNALFFQRYQGLLRVPYDHGLKHTAEQSKWFTAEALKAQSLEFTARSLFAKVRALFSGDEVQRNVDGYAMRQDSPVLAVLMWKYGLAFPVGLLLPLGIGGVVVAWRQRLPGTAMLAAFLGTHAAYLLAFFVTDRYRGEILPLLAVFAPLAVVAIAQKLVQPLSVLVAALLVTANVGLSPMAMEQPAYVQSNVANQLFEEGRQDEAISLYRRAIAQEPHVPALWFNLGNALRETGRPQEALEPLQMAVKGAPRSLKARLLLAATAEQAGQHPLATQAALAALELEPCHPEALALAQQAASEAPPEVQQRVRVSIGACGASPTEQDGKGGAH